MLRLFTNNSVRNTTNDNPTPYKKINIAGSMSTIETEMNLALRPEHFGFFVYNNEFSRS